MNTATGSQADTHRTSMFHHLFQALFASLVVGIGSSLILGLAVLGLIISNS